MSRRTRSVVVAVTLWLAVVATTSTAAWVAIDRTGRGAYLTDGVGAGVPQALPVPTTTSSAASSTAPAPRRPPSTTRTGTGSVPVSTPPTRSATSAPRSTTRPVATTPSSTRQTAPAPPRPAPVADSVSVEGGAVGVSCRGATLTLGFVTPADGWAYHLDRSPEAIEVSFRQQRGEGESEVHAECEHGVPVFETSSHSPSSSSSQDLTESPG